MDIKSFADDIAEEIETILSSSFQIEVTNTTTLPHSSDSGITFPNLDTKVQRCKVIETSVLYIDIRRSTQLNLQHKPHTVAKLYSSFVSAMTRCATYHGGHVRGIIGDRIMVLFNPSTAYTDAVNTAILMNSTSKHLLNKYFKANEISCGIGIDYGRMLVTKTGIKRRGVERHNYQSLVWLGRPANVASKLTDVANKSEDSERPVIRQARKNILSALGLGNLFGVGGTPNDDLVWENVEAEDFLKDIEKDYSRPGNYWRHKDSSVELGYVSTAFDTKKTPPILMTKPVFDGYRSANPDALAVKNRWFKKQSISVPGYAGNIYGGDVIKTAFQNM